MEERPIFTAYDSYLFARYAEDYKLGIFEPGGGDHLRFVPDNATYPSVIPFYSWLFAELSSITNSHIENLAFWLIPIFASLVVVPLVLLFWRENLPLAGLGAALFGSLALIYVIRTSIVRLDTDSIVLFSLFAVPFAVHLFATSEGKKKYLALLLVALFSNLFYWGYIHPDLNFVLWVSSVLFLGFPFLLRLVKEKRWSKPDKGLLTDLALLTVAFNPYVLLSGGIDLVGRLLRYVFEFGKPIEGNFPNVQISISELQKLSIKQLSILTVGNEIALFVGFLGLVIFAVFRFRLFLLLLPVLLMGLLSLKGSSRFAMFLAPFLGVGIGILFDLLKGWIDNFLNKEGWKIAVLVGLSLTLSVFAYYLERRSFEFVPKPIMTSSVAEAFMEVGRQTPPDAWIMTWWDYGYAIQYYARRATFHDGGSQYSPKTYFIARAFTTDNASEAVNITKTLTFCGSKCIEKLLKEGKSAKEIKELFAEGELLKGRKISQPVYWVFTGDLIGKFYWISYFGTWNFDTLKGEHLFLSPIVCAGPAPNSLICRQGGGVFKLDLANFRMEVGKGRYMPIKYFAVRSEDKLDVKENPYALMGYAVEAVYTYLPKNFMWFLMQDKTFKTMFNRLYPLRDDSLKEFERVKERFPDYVFYLVR